EEFDLFGDEAGLLGRKLMYNDGPGTTVGRVGAELKAVSELGNDADVALSPPFAVRDHVEAGSFLQRDRGADCVAHQSLVFVALDGAVVGDEVLDELRAWEGADDGGGEEHYDE